MPDIKGDRLYVNLGASQTRRRLRGFGHGVKKVETAGRHRAVIIHTAYGRSLAELEAKFADVGCSRTDAELGEPIETLKNIGPASAAILREVGIATTAELRHHGPVAVFRRVRERRPTTTIHLLWALAAGLAELDWQQLSQAERDRLAAEAGEL